MRYLHTHMLVSAYQIGLTTHRKNLTTNFEKIPILGTKLVLA
jgi:hypothetical protein